MQQGWNGRAFHCMAWSRRCEGCRTLTGAAVPPRRDGPSIVVQCARALERLCSENGCPDGTETDMPHSSSTQCNASGRFPSDCAVYTSNFPEIRHDSGSDSGSCPSTQPVLLDQITA